MRDGDDEVPAPVRRLRALAETRAVLAKASSTWSRWSCPGTSECCQLATTKRPPWLWPSEWALLRQRLERERRPLPPPRDDGGCPFLDASGRRCTVYEDRPFGCRTFFCHRVMGPSQVPSAVTNALLDQLRGANLAWEDDAAPRSLPEWHAAALAGAEG